MIDAALRTMIDEVLPAGGKLRDPALELRAPALIWNSAMPLSVDSLLDLSALTDRADRLVKAARAAGADAADAVAVRSMSLAIEVRDGNTEESERAEGDDLGLRVFVGRRQAVVSTNEVTANGAAVLAERAVAMARVTPEDKFAGLADEKQLARKFPELDLIDPDLPSVQELEAMARAAEEAGLAVKGVSKSGGASASAGIGGVVLVTSHGFHGDYLGSNHGVSMTAIAGEGTGMERDYDYSAVRHPGDLESPEKIGHSAAQRAIARLNPRKVSTRKVPVVFDPRSAGSLVSHLASAVDRAQDQLPARQDGGEAVRRRDSHYRRPAAQTRTALASVRRRRRRREKAC